MPDVSPLRRRLISIHAETWNRVAYFSLLTVFVFTAVYHLYIVQKYAVNIPYWDDWAMFTNNHPASLDWSWLYEQANDHRTTTTKLLAWTLYHVNGWNIKEQLVINFLIYAACVSFLCWYVSRLSSQVPRWLNVALSLFLFSPIIWLNHGMAYEVAVHFWLLGFLLSAFSFFHESQTWKMVVLGCVAAVFSMYSFASGIATTVVVFVFLTVFKLRRAHRAEEPRLRRREVLQLSVIATVLGTALAIWFAGWHRTPARLPWVWPHRWKFWEFFLNLISFSFGIQQTSSLLGAACLLFLVVPVAILLCKRRSKLSAGQWASVALIAALLADLALISLSRAEYGLWSAKFPYYGEHGMPLILLSGIVIGFALGHRPRLKAAALAFLFLFCAISFSDDWTTANYQKLYADKIEGRNCVGKYYREGSFSAPTTDARCPTIYPWPGSMVLTLEEAKRLHASFYQELTQARDSPP